MATTGLPTVTVEQFTSIVKANFNEGNTRPIFGLGRGGIGKTESIADLARKELKVGYIDIRLLMYAETDLKGIPFPDITNSSTIWLQNKILPTIEKDGERGILVLDEITSVARSVRTAAYQLLNERRLGEYTLPDGWMIVCLGNGEEDGGDFQGMEGNFANRCSIFNVTSDVDSFKHWGYNNKVHHLVLGYVSWRPSDLHTFDPNNETDMLFASPRSWKAVADILNAKDYDSHDDLQHKRIMANIGTKIGQQFLAFCKFKDIAVNPSDILEGARVPRISDYEVLYMTMQGVSKLMSDHVRMDFENSGAISNDTFRKCANGMRWVLTLERGDQKAMAIKDFIGANPRMNNQVLLDSRFDNMCPEYRQFAKENAAVFRKS